MDELVFAKIEKMSDFWPIFNKAKEHRKVGSTMCNDVSSRSHCIF